MFDRKSILNLLLLLIFLSALIYTRFVGLDWGLPYPMHPDERNMAIAIQQMDCSAQLSLDCLNPHFFAYGQLPLFLGYLLTLFNIDVTYSLRMIAAAASVLTAIVMFKTVLILLPDKSSLRSAAAAILLIFCPAFIQFSHFGTTESLLMFYISLMIYITTLLVHEKILLSGYVFWTAIIFGLAMSTKVSAVIFVSIPPTAFGILLFKNFSVERLLQLLFALIKFALLAGVILVVTSPFNLLDWNSFLHSMNYESSVGLGSYKAFYTRQFEYTSPIIFPLLRIFPQALGQPGLILFFLGWLFLPWKRDFIFLRLVAIFLFLPSAFVYAQWSRFYAPLFPVLSLLAILFLLKIPNRLIMVIILIIAAIPGVAYLNIYRHPDVRFVASEWIEKNIPAGSEILSETANVVDIPIASARGLHPISFNFYDTDHDISLERELTEHLRKVNYIFVPSRRIFANHACHLPKKDSRVLLKFLKPFEPFQTQRCESLSENYPLLDAYYSELFSGKLGFVEVAKFSSYPRLTIFGRTLIEFPDEFSAEETWTVFDHPVIRIFKKI